MTMDHIIIDKQNFWEKMALLYAYLLKKPKQEFEIIAKVGKKSSTLFLDSKEYKELERWPWQSSEDCVKDLQSKVKK